MTPLRTPDRPTSTAEAHPSTLLRTGDRLDADTFIHLYERSPEGFRAELIGGIVYVALPMTIEHGGPNSDVSGWLMVYRSRTTGIRQFGAATIRLGSNDSPEPDASLVILPEYGGQASFQGGYIIGAPELVVEVAYSTRATDLTDKLKTYENASVREYVVVVPRDKTVLWFVHREGRLERHPADDDGLFRSTVFPGLWLDADALFRDDAAQVLSTVDRGTKTPEHAEFVARLAANRLKSS